MHRPQTYVCTERPFVLPSGPLTTEEAMDEGPHAPATSDPRVRRRGGAPPGLPAERPGDREGRRPHVDVDGPRPPDRPGGQGIPAARLHQAPGAQRPLRAVV